MLPVHQKLEVDLDVTGRRISGYTDIVLLPARGDSDPSHIGLNADKSQMRVLSVTIDGEEAKFIHTQVHGFRKSSNRDRKQMAGSQEGGQSESLQFQRERAYFGLEEVRGVLDAKAREFERTDLADRGELLVEVPDPVLKRRQKQRESQADAVDIMSIDGGREEEGALIVRVVFVVTNPQAGVHCVLPHNSIYKNRPIQMFSYTADSRPSSWFPCIESQDALCTFTTSFTCPKKYAVVSTGTSTHNNNNNNNNNNNASPPDAKTPQSSTSSRGDRHSFKFEVRRRVSARAIGFACGPFDAMELPLRGDDAGGVPVEVFMCWEPKHLNLGRLKRIHLRAKALERVGNTMACLHDILRVYSKYLRMEYPFGSYKHVLVHEAARPFTAHAGMVFTHVDLLHDRDIIDQTYKTRRLFALCVAKAWVGHVMWVKSLADKWLIEGVAGILVNKYLRETFGKNEASYQNRAAALRVVEEEDPTYPHSSSVPTPDQSIGTHTMDLDDGKSAKKAKPIDSRCQGKPLAWPAFTGMAEAGLARRREKATLVMAVLERKIGGDSFRDLVANLISKADATKSDKAATTKNFIKLCKKNMRSTEERRDLSHFAEQFIYGTKYPRLHVKFGFKKKKSYETELHIVQDLRTPKEVLMGLPLSVTPPRPRRSPARRRSPSIRSPQRTPLRGSPSRRAESKTEGHKGKGSGMVFKGTLVVCIYEIDKFTKDRVLVEHPVCSHVFKCTSRLKRNRTRRVIDSEEKLLLEEGINSLLQRRIEYPIYYVRLDPEHAWLRPVQVTQHEVMWIHQLQKDKDVLSQLDAIEGIKRLGPKADPLLSPQALQNVLKDKKYFVRVRAAAAAALAYTSGAGSLSVGAQENGVLNFLITDFLKQDYYDTGSQTWKPNSFTDIAKHFLKRSVITTLSNVKDKEALTPPEVIRLLFKLLKNNDNSRNLFSDAYYLSDLIRGLGSIRLSKTEASDRETIWKYLAYFLDYDQVIPSYQNLITQACLEAACDLQLSGELAMSRVEHRKYCGYANYEGIRATALRCLIRRIAKFPHTATEVLDLLISDRNLWVRLDTLSWWARQWERQPPIVSQFRSSRSERHGMQDVKSSSLLQDRLWEILTDSPDEDIRFAAERLYAAIWGYGDDFRKEIQTSQVYRTVAQNPPVGGVMRRWDKAVKDLDEAQNKKQNTSRMIINIPAGRRPPTPSTRTPNTRTPRTKTPARY